MTCFPCYNELMQAQLNQTKPVNLSELLPSVRSLRIHDKMRLIRILAEDIESGWEVDGRDDYLAWDDEGEIRPELVAELLEQRAAMEAGARTYTLNEVVEILGLDVDEGSSFG